MKKDSKAPPKTSRFHGEMGHRRPGFSHPDTFICYERGFDFGFGFLFVGAGHEVSVGTTQRPVEHACLVRRTKPEGS